MLTQLIKIIGSSLVFLILFQYQCMADVFTENKGQHPLEVLYSAEIQGGYAYITKTGIRFDLKNYSFPKDTGQFGPHGPRPSHVTGHVFDLVWNNSKYTDWQIIEQNKIPERKNYFLGNDESKWASNCESFQKISINNLYPNVTLELLISSGQLKWNFVSESPEDLKQISWYYNGIDAQLKRKNKIELKSKLGIIEEYLPYSFYTQSRDLTDVEYIQNNNAFSLDPKSSFFKKSGITVDPILTFSTYSGSTTDNFGYTASFDFEGFLYSGSSAFGNQYPTSVGAYDQTFGGSVDIAISKFDTSGTFLVYSTYLGGSSDELPHSLVCNTDGELFILGSTSSLNFPTQNAFQPTLNGGPNTSVGGLGIEYNNGADLIISKLSKNGDKLLASTFFGGTENDGFIDNRSNQTTFIYNYADEVRGEIDLDDNGNIWVVSSSYSKNFPLVGNSFQTDNAGNCDAVILKLNQELSPLFTSYFGGSGFDSGFSIQKSKTGKMVFGGGTNSQDINATNAGLQTAYGGGRNDGYIAILDTTNLTVDGFSYWGSPDYDNIYFVDVDTENNITCYGQTNNNNNHFIQNANNYADQNSCQFISKFTPDLGALVFSTTFGNGKGIPNISPTAFQTDACDKIFVAGWGSNTNANSSYNGAISLSTRDMKVTNDAIQSTTDNDDLYLAIFDKNMDNLLFGSFMGGNTSHEHVDGGTSRFDKAGIVYHAVCAGCTRNSDFPIFPSNAVSPTNNSNNCNLAVFKIDPELDITAANFLVGGPYCDGDEIQLNNTSQFYNDVFWDFGDGNTSTEVNPSHTFNGPGEYTIRLEVTSNFSCNSGDFIEKTVTIVEGGFSEEIDTIACLDDQINIDLTINNPEVEIEWQPALPNGSTDATTYNFTANNNFSYNVQFKIGQCIESYPVNISTIDLDPLSLNDSLSCGVSANINLASNNNGFNTGYEWSFNPNYNPLINDSPTDDNVNITYTQDTTVYLRVFTDYCEFVDTVNLRLIDVIIDLPDTLLICYEDSIDVSPSYSSSNSNFDINWEQKIGVNQLNLEGDAKIFVFGENYKVEISNEICIDSALIFVDRTKLVKEQPKITTDNDVLCSAEEFAELRAEHNGSATKFEWSKHPNFTPIMAEFLTDSIINVKINEQETIYLRMSDGQCEAFDSISIYQITSVLNLQDSLYLCREDSVKIEALIFSEKSDYDISWEPSNLVNTPDTNVIWVQDYKQYYVVEIEFEQCKLRDSIYIDQSIYVNLTPTLSIVDTILTANKFIVEATLNPVFQYFWFPASLIDDQNSLIQEIQVIRPETIIVTHVDPRLTSCQSADSVFLNPLSKYCDTPNLFIPTAFSPNNDGNNDKLKVMGAGIESMTLEIFDQWGQKVFETSDQKIGWDGTFEGQLLNPAVFTYQFSGICVDKSSAKLKGNITLIR